MDKSLFEILPKKFTINYNNIKYVGGMAHLYSIPKTKLVKILKKTEDLDFITNMVIHQEKISKKLGEKGYNVPRVFGSFKIYHENKGIFLPGFVNEDMYFLKRMDSLYGFNFDYFFNLYKEILINLKKDGFVPGDFKKENILCDLNLKKIYLIDYDDWDYIKNEEKIITPRYNYLDNIFFKKI